MNPGRSTPDRLPGMFIRAELIRRYAEQMGIELANSEFDYCFDLFRLAVIRRQICNRFYHSQTKNERFKLMIVAIRVLEETARKLIE